MEIKVLFVPANPYQPAEVRDIDTGELSAYQQLVGGDIEVIDLFHPKARLLVNMEGAAQGLAPNPRATALTLLHHARISLDTTILGDAVLTGPIDHVGFEMQVPTKYIVQLEAK